MSMRTWIPRLAPLILLAFLAPLAPADEGETDKAKAAAAAQARAYERERLVRTARRAVGRRGTGRDPFEAMQKALAADRAYAQAYQPKDAEERALLAEFDKTVEERIRLVGWPGEDGGSPALDGALQEARRLDDWLAGLATCDVVVSDRGSDPADGRPYHWPPEPEKPKVAPPPTPAEEGAVEAPPPGPPPAEGEATPSEGEPAEAPSEPAEPEAKAEPEKAPEPPMPTTRPTSKELDLWAESVIQAHESGTLLGKVVTAQVCGVADRLLGAARQSPAYVHPDVRRLSRHAVVSEDVFAYNAPYAAFRLAQAREREQFMQHDQPPSSLVDESMVRSKAAQVATYRAGFADRKKQYAQVIQALDRMVEDLDAWRTQAALLAQEIEERQRALLPPKDETPSGEDDEAGDEEADDEEDVVPPEPPPAPLALRVAEARESLVSLDITLLYMTAVRADERMALLRKLMNAAEAEAQSAEQAHTRYESALLKLRGARRLDRLYGDEHRLRLWVSRLEESEPQEGSTRARRLDAYRAALALLEVVADAVVRQRQLTPGGAEEQDDDAEADAERPAAAPAPAPDAAAGSSKAESQEIELPSILLTPERATWDVKYVELATRALEAPKLRRAFSARLIARHYAAVDNRIRALLVARDRSTEEASLRERYDTASAAAEAAVSQLPRSDLAVRTHRLPNLLRVAGEDFEAAMNGIGEQGIRNRKRLEALLEYRALLSAQGTKSLLIRTDPDLADDHIRRAFDDTSAAVTQATRWLTLEDDEHALHFLASSWWRLLALLVLVVVAVFGVWFLRRRIDAWIEKQAAANPLLRHAGASIREESAEAKRRRAEGDTVVEVTAEDILQAEADEAEDEPQGETDAEREVRKAHEIQPPTTKPDADADAKPAGAEGGAR